MPKEQEDVREKGKFGDRIDKRNLIGEWEEKMKREGNKYTYVWNMSDFEQLDASQNHTHILGLLAYDHLEWEELRVKKEPIEEPSLVEMTRKAIEILSQNPHGYFLFVEGGRIDHGHHQSNARLALDEFVLFDESIGQALKLTDESDTQIVVTADHSHVFNLGGYSFRGNPILGISINPSTNLTQNNLNVTYTSLTYGNGPGGLKSIRTYNLTNNLTEGLNYTQESAVYLKSETHGGEDVPIYASGPMSWLFQGTVEQSYIAHAIAFSMCIGPYSLTNDPKCVEKHRIFYDSNFNDSQMFEIRQTNFSYIKLPSQLLILVLNFFLFIICF
jgi:alkaline phosphatase